MNEVITNETDFTDCNSLYKLLEKCEIRIPIIQRDYAQGGDNEKANEVRRRLLDDIKRVFEDNTKLDFNFVYGNLDDNIFYPVDGQQRLTTLYLLHWFLACKSGLIEEFNSHYKFSYMTRNSATEFFSLLKSSNSELCKMVQTSRSFKEDILNYPWFKFEWNNDPTVISALNMLDALCKINFEGKELLYYQKLIDNEDPAIHFKVLVEERRNAEAAAAIKYIRMNARGKVLTTFENVKAMLDSIDKKLDESTNIIFNYDTSFIDIFYNNAKDDIDIDTKTKKIDNQTMNFVRNMYNVAAEVKGKVIFNDDLSYSNAMYSYTQNLKDKEFFKFYFDMMEAVLCFRRRNEDAGNLIDLVFQDKFHPDIDKLQVAYFLYIYHLHCNKKGNESFAIKTEIIKKFGYVLVNLDYEKWEQQQYKQVYQLASNVSRMNDIIEFFATNPPETILSGDYQITNIIDIKQRIKEQSIKSQIILLKSINWDYFNRLETQSQCRRIQYLLWITDLWQNQITEYKITILQNYMEIADTYFKNTNKELEWRKLFAIAGNWDCKNDRLLDSASINLQTNERWGKDCFWDNDNYFWADDQEPNLDKLNIVKRTYDLILKHNNSSLLVDVNVQLQDSSYDVCWLKYAVNRNYLSLLTNRIAFSDQQLIINVNYSARDYFSYVLLLDKTKEIKRDGLRYSLEYVVYSCFGGFGNCQFKSFRDNTLTFLANKRYVNSTKTISHYDARNYNLNLHGEVNVKFGNMPNNDTVYTYDGRNYTVYKHIPQTNSFVVYICDISIYKQDIGNLLDQISEDQEAIRKAMKINNYDKILEIYNGDNINWSHHGGNTHQWDYITDFGVDLVKQKDNYDLT